MKVLVVDDEKDVQTLFEQRFRKEIRNGEIQLRFAFSGGPRLVSISIVTMVSVLQCLHTFGLYTSAVDCGGRITCVAVCNLMHGMVIFLLVLLSIP